MKYKTQDLLFKRDLYTIRQVEEASTKIKQIVGSNNFKLSKEDFMLTPWDLSLYAIKRESDINKEKTTETNLSLLNSKNKFHH